MKQLLQHSTLCYKSYALLKVPTDIAINGFIVLLKINENTSNTDVLGLWISRGKFHMIMIIKGREGAV